MEQGQSLPKSSSRDFPRRHEQKDKQGGQVSRTSGNKGSKSSWAVEEGRTAVDNTQCELIDKDDTCSMEQASTGRAGDHGPRKDANPKTYSGGTSAAICSQPPAIQDGSRKYGPEQEEQASTGSAGDHGPRTDANPKTYSGSQEFSRRHEQKDKQGGQVSITSGNKGSKSNWEVEEGRTAVDNTQCELIDMDDTCSMEQASAARAGDHGPGSWDFSRRHEQKDKQGGRVSRTSGNKGSKSNLEVEEGRTAVDNTQCELIDKDDTCSMEQASASSAGDHGPAAVDPTRSASEGPDEDEAADAGASLCCFWSWMCPCISSGQQDVKENIEEQLERLCGTLKANKSAQTQEMAKFCSILIQITEITGPINEQLKDYEHLSALFVDENRAELIERVGTPIPIADSLFPKNIIEHQQYQEIQAARTSQERMRLIYTALNSAEAKKAAFLELLVQKDRYLVQDLARKKLGQLDNLKTEEYAD